MSDTKELTRAIVEMEEGKALDLTRQLLESGIDPVSVFDAFQEAMAEVGKRFEAGTYFIPELVMSGDMMGSAMEIIKPYLKDTDTGESAKKGKILIATIEGDIHDIGKNIVTTLLSLNGFDVKDIGVDVPIDQIVSEAKAFDADVIGLSGLLTLAFDPMKKVVEKLEEEGMRDKVKVVIGGGQMDEQVCKYVGADAFVIDAVAGINLCKEWVH
jgi:5-methyltetrahydrofolate--homocysteine methyltransferase